MFGKLWKAFVAQINKLANFFWQADPIAQMQLEYDSALEQLKEGRKGLEQHRALVERVSRQVKTNERRVEDLSAKIKACLKAGDRETAGKHALELRDAKADLAENREQVGIHETTYENNVKKIQAAARRLTDIRAKIKKYDAELKMSEAEAEMSQLAQSFDFDITTDFGQAEQAIQEKIDLNRAKSRVAADLSKEKLEDIEAAQRAESALAEDVLTQFEAEMEIGRAHV